MSEHKIGLRVFLLKSDQIGSFEKWVLSAEQTRIPLTQALDRVFIPFRLRNRSIEERQARHVPGSILHPACRRFLRWLERRNKPKFEAAFSPYSERIRLLDSVIAIRFSYVGYH